MTGELMTLDDAIKVYGPEILDFLEKTQTYEFGTGSFVTRPAIGDGVFAIRPKLSGGSSLVSVFGGLGQPVAFLDAAYQVILSKAVPTRETGYLQEISFFSNKPSTTDYRVTIAGVVFVDGEKSQTSAGFVWRLNGGRGLKLNAGAVVLIEAKNPTDTVTVTGLITGTSEK